MQKLSQEEVKRYSRHLVLPGFGMESQVKLKAGAVLVIGAGGLGSPALLYLTAAGVGSIGIADDDTVSLSNLQRQVLYTIDDLGKPKTDQAKARLLKLNPHIHFHTHPSITKENALEILKNYDVVIDGSDNFPTRYLVNDACILLNKPLVYGAILKYEGQVSVFNYQFEKGVFSANYRDLFPTPPEPGTVLNCEEIGVIGVLPGIIGAMQANEAIKILSKNTDVLYDTLVLYDSQSGAMEKISIPNRNSRESVTELIDYEYFCGEKVSLNNSLEMKEITVQELQALKNNGTHFQLIDVREPYEFETGNIDAMNIPMSQIPSQIDRISTDCQVIFHCKSGNRSMQMVQWVEKHHGHTNLVSLKGGIKAWVEEIDDSIEID